MNYLLYGVVALIFVCYSVYKKCYQNIDQFTDQPAATEQYVSTNQPVSTNKTEQYVESKRDLTRCTQYTRLYNRPNKCFSCEKDILRNAGPKYINYAFPGKCFSCERQSKTPYNEGPTKCFSCE